MSPATRNISRRLTEGERALARSIFKNAIDYDKVRLHRRKWIFFQPTKTTMAPDGHIWFHPDSPNWRDDFAGSDKQGHFIHEMTHVWQAQTKGRWYLPVMRHPFCRYEYAFVAGRPFHKYGLEQQAEIVRHLFLLRRGYELDAAPPLEALEALAPFTARSDAASQAGPHQGSTSGGR